MTDKTICPLQYAYLNNESVYDKMSCKMPERGCDKEKCWEEYERLKEEQTNG